MNNTDAFNIRGMTPLKLAEVLWNCQPGISRSWKEFSKFAEEDGQRGVNCRKAMNTQIEHAKCVIAMLATEGLVQ